MLKGYIFEILPNDEQQELIWKTIGCNRLVYNLMLDLKIRKHKNEGISLSKFDLDKRVAKLKHKEKYSFFNEIDSLSLQVTTDNLNQAFQRFFKGQNKYPKFKSKHFSRQAYTTYFVNGNIKVLFKSQQIQLPKLGKVDAKLYRKLKGKIKRATVCYEGNKFWCSIQVDTSKTKKLQKKKQVCGIDLGIKNFATICYKDSIDLKSVRYEIVENPKFLKQSQDRLKKLQEKLSKKQKGVWDKEKHEYKKGKNPSNNYLKLKKKVNKQHKKVKNQRLNFQHKLSKKLIDENQVICIEDLQVKKMIQQALSDSIKDSIHDAAFYQFKNMLEYKAEWYGRDLIKVDTYYPSSQLCWKCRKKDHKVKDLTVRRWTCSHCGNVHDRDKNAARNILTEGLRVLSGV